MNIFQAQLKDLETLVPLFDGYRVFYKQTSDLMAAKQFLEKRLQKKDAVIFLATSEAGEGLGFTQLYPTFSSVSMESFYILNDLFVLPTQRGKGIGEALLLHAQQFAKETNLKGLALETAVDNPAQALYERLGWEKNKDFYHYFWKC